MKARKRAYRETISRLKRENEEQLDTIRGLCLDLKIKNKLNMSVSPSNSGYNNSAKKIKEMELILAEKKSKLDNLKDIIADYLQKAEAFEEQLIKKEQENELLLLSIQKMANSQPSELSLSQLESETSSMKARKRFYNSKNQMSNSRKSFANCNKNSRRSNENQANLNEILNQKRFTVQVLRKKLEDAHKIINNLEADSRLLKNVIASSCENNTEQY